MSVEAEFPNSSSILKVSYNHLSGVLVVSFRSGKTYQYFQVPPELVDQMLETKEAGDSAGKFFHKNIRTKFEYSQV